MNYVAVLVGDAGGIGAEMRDLARWSVPDELIEQGASERNFFRLRLISPIDLGVGLCVCLVRY